MNTNDTPQFSPSFTAAVDALVDNKFNLDQINPDAVEQVEPVHHLLQLLDHLPAESTGDLLVPRTLQAIESAKLTGQRAGAGSAQAVPVAPIAELSEADQAALDAYMAANFDLAGVDEALRERAKRVADVLGLLDELPSELGAPAPSTLVSGTLSRIKEQERKDRLSQQINSMAIGASAGGQSGGLRWAELIAMAAMFLIGISLFWPMIDHSNAVARQAVCQSNLMAAGSGMLAYANDHNGAMPSVQARLGDEWWHTNKFDEQGNAHSNSAHLYKLYTAGYTKDGTLNCPENPYAPSTLTAGMRDWSSARATSYAYQNQYSLNKPKLNGNLRIVILSDKNPYFGPGEYNMKLSRTANSPNHNKLGGQNVLLSSGRVMWLTSPKVNGDHIYQAGDEWQDNYTGTEGPADQKDSFLVGP